jgi:archaellum component FlaG (FlaF/FlaG flagellin family)
MVKFPEVQYICTMTDFEYNQANRILSMEQKGKKSGTLMKPDNLLRVPLNGTDRPTFFATNRLKDTIAFASLSAKYHVDEEYIEAENINYIKVADALIQPENGKVKISRRAVMGETKKCSCCCQQPSSLFIQQP